MPHVHIEYSSNIKPPKNFGALFDQLHQLLNKTIAAKIASCKSRATQHEEFYLGDGQPGVAFVHTHLQILPGRTTTEIKELSEKTMSLIKQHFDLNQTVHFSVNVSELSDVYTKETYHPQ